MLTWNTNQTRCDYNWTCKKMNSWRCKTKIRRLYEKTVKTINIYMKTIKFLLSQLTEQNMKGPSSAAVSHWRCNRFLNNTTTKNTDNPFRAQEEYPNQFSGEVLQPASAQATTVFLSGVSNAESSETPAPFHSLLIRVCISHSFMSMLLCSRVIMGVCIQK